MHVLLIFFRPFYSFNYLPGVRRLEVGTPEVGGG